MFSCLSIVPKRMLSAFVAIISFGGCCMNTTSERLIYRAQIVSDACPISGTKLFVSFGPEYLPLRDSSGNLLDLTTNYVFDESGAVHFLGGTTQSRCPSEKPDYLHSAPLLLYFDHPTCADYYDSLPAARLKQLLRVTPEEAGYTRGPKEVGVWLLPTLRIEPDTAYETVKAKMAQLSSYDRTIRFVYVSPEGTPIVPPSNAVYEPFPLSGSGTVPFVLEGLSQFP